MIALNSTMYRLVAIGGKKFVLGLHPKSPEPLISIRPFKRRVGYTVPISTVRVQGALAYGRAEQAAKREARKNGIPWKSARRKFLSTIIPPAVKRQKKGQAR